MIKIIKGNLLDSNADIICHQCNCQGAMNSGVAAEVRKRHPEVYRSYYNDYQKGKLKLGYVSFVPTYLNQIIANLCGQDKYGYDGSQYTNYNKLQECFDKVVDYASMKQSTIAFPYGIGCGRGGGDWNIVFKMIEDTFKDFEVEIWKLD